VVSKHPIVLSRRTTHNPRGNPQPPPTPKGAGKDEYASERKRNSLNYVTVCVLARTFGAIIYVLNNIVVAMKADNCFAKLGTNRELVSHITGY
jgi:hypothetical protein